MIRRLIILLLIVGCEEDNKAICYNRQCYGVYSFIGGNDVSSENCETHCWNWVDSEASCVINGTIYQNNITCEEHCNSDTLYEFEFIPDGDWECIIRNE